jgi:ribosomal protein S18 acetylase RimI-like enzyme
MVAAVSTASRLRPALTWRALDGDLVAGEVSARLRPDNQWFLYFDTWRADAYPPLADAVARELGRDLYVTLEDAEYDALDACAEAGFAVHRRESYYRIPTDPVVTGGPRLGLIATLTQYRRRGVARTLLGRALAVLAARGDTSVVAEVDDTNVASLSLLTGRGARRYGGNVELIRRQPGRSARDWPEEERPSAGS